eukprot:GHVP01019197.1.p1 GENE.GHVP01019197.1~~GHVP01019197.1.p1  ORF type:complete len:1191 (-),score=173.06 GHVP01019197.1:50-3622(-)
MGNMSCPQKRNHEDIQEDQISNNKTSINQEFLSDIDMSDHEDQVSNNKPGEKFNKTSINQELLSDIDMSDLEDNNYNQNESASIDKQFENIQDTSNPKFRQKEPINSNKKKDKNGQIPNIKPSNNTNQELLSDLDMSDLEDLLTEEPVEPHIKELNLYLLDAFIDCNNLVISGKTDKNKSMCIKIKSMNKSIFFVPKDPSDTTLISLENEVKRIMQTYRIDGYKISIVERTPLFKNSSINGRVGCIQCTYTPKTYMIPNDIKGDFFLYISGLDSNKIESFLIEKEIKGPCWLKITDLHIESKILGKTNLQYNTNSIDNITLITKQQKTRKVKDSTENPYSQQEKAGFKPYDTSVHPQQTTPPLNILSVAYFSVMEKNQRSVAAIAMSYYKNIDLDSQDPYADPTTQRILLRADLPCLSTKEAFDDIKNNTKDVLFSPNESTLLNTFCFNTEQLDPNIIIGHCLLDDMAPFLLKRHCSLNQNAKRFIGKFNRKMDNSILSENGRIICDTHIFAKENVSTSNATLHNLSVEFLGYNEYDPPTLPIISHNIQLSSLIKNINSVFLDSKKVYSLSAILMTLQLTKEISNVAGNLWSKTLSGSRAIRTEFLLLHEFHNKGIVYPPHVKRDIDRKNGRYSGGLVLTPKKGLYENIVVLLDFNSLYPSVIQEFDICFTTYSSDEITDSFYPSSVKNRVGILPDVLQRLVDKRKVVRNSIKEPSLSILEKKTLDIKQKALKLTANSVYGCLGYSGARFYAPHLAELITRIGRSLLEKAVDTSEKMGYTVIYGDTDSIMVETGTTKISVAKEIAETIKENICSEYNVLEIGLDSVYKRLLLLQKKKYCALLEDGKIEMKGLETVRRDWCKYAKNASMNIINILLNTHSSENVKTLIYDNLLKFIDNMNNEVKNKSIDNFILIKNLVKNPEEYSEINGNPHATVALRMKQKGYSVFPGLSIPHVICKRQSDNGSRSVSDNAFHIEELKEDSSLNINVDWYIKNQIYPALQRLCSHVSGFDDNTLRKCLGLKESFSYNYVEEDIDESIDEKKELSFICSECNKEFKWSRSEYIKNGKRISSSICGFCDKEISTLSLINQLTNTIRKDISDLYKHTLKCTNCSYQRDNIRISVNVCAMCNSKLVKKITHEKLYNQLLYYKDLFDSENKSESISKLQEKCKEFIFKSPYPIINTKSLLSNFHL